MRLRNLFLSAALPAMMCVSLLTSCTVGTVDTPINDDTEAPEFQTGYHGIIYSHKAYIAGSVSGELLEALKLCIPNLQVTVDDDTRLVILGSFSDLDEATLEQVYNNGATIAVAYPTTADIETFFSAHPDWASLVDAAHADKALLYSFSNDHCFSFVALPETNEDDCEDGDVETDLPGSYNPSLGEEVADLQTGFYPPYYTFVGSWLNHLIEDEAGENDHSNGLLQSPNTGDGITQKSLDEVAQCSHYCVVKNYTINQEMRHLPLSGKDMIKGSGVLTLTYDIHQLHVYEGYNGAGDYYFVDMTASVANDGMFKGKWWNKHGGCYVRLCGLYGTGYSVKNTLVDSKNKEVDVAFISAGMPTPETTTGSTTYQKSMSVNLSYSMAAGTQNGKPLAQASLSNGFTWTNSETRTIADTEIRNLSNDKTAAWEVVFNNLPKYDWNQKYGFNIGNSLTFRSTQYLHGAWVWYQKDAKDDVDKANLPYKIHYVVEADYAGMSFLTTKADLRTKKPSVKYDEYLTINNTIFNKKAGCLNLENTFTDMTISEVSVIDTKTGKVIYTDPQNYSPGEVGELGGYALSGAYTVTFKAGKDKASAKSYSYKNGSGGNVITLKKDAILTLKSAYDFQ